MATVTPPRTSQHVHQNAHLLHVDHPRRRPSFSVPDLDYKMKMMQLTLHFRTAAVAASSSSPGIRRSPASSRHSLGTFLRTEPAPGSVHQPKILAVEPKFKPVNAVKPCCSNLPRSAAAKVVVSVKSATLPAVPQQTKVRRLVQLFEDGSGTTVKVSRAEPVKPLRIKASIKVKPVQNVTVEEGSKLVQKPEAIQQESTTPRSTILVQQAIKRMSPEPIKSPEPVKSQELVKTPEPVKTPESVKTPEPMKTPEPIKEETSSPLVDDEAIKNSLRQRRKVKELCKFFEQQAKN